MTDPSSETRPSLSDDRFQRLAREHFIDGLTIPEIAERLGRDVEEVICARPAARQGATALRCSFCNKSQEEVVLVVAAPLACICNFCVDVCAEEIRIRRPDAFGWSKPPAPRFKFLSPKSWLAPLTVPIILSPLFIALWRGGSFVSQPDSTFASREQTARLAAQLKREGRNFDDYCRKNGFDAAVHVRGGAIHCLIRVPPELAGLYGTSGSGEIELDVTQAREYSSEAWAVRD